MAWVKRNHGGGGEGNTPSQMSQPIKPPPGFGGPTQQDFPSLGNTPKERTPVDTQGKNNRRPGTTGAGGNGVGRGAGGNGFKHNESPPKGAGGGNGHSNNNNMATPVEAPNNNNNQEAQRMDTPREPPTTPMGNILRGGSAGRGMTNLGVAPDQTTTPTQRAFGRGRAKPVVPHTRPGEAVQTTVAQGPPPSKAVEAPTVVQASEIQASLPPPPMESELVAEGPVGPRVDPRVEAEQELIQDLTNRLAVERHQPRIEFVRRPGKGTQGRKFPVCANHFPLIIPSGFVFHYDVEIAVVRKEAPGDARTFDRKKLRPLSLKMNRLIVETMRLTYPQFKNCYPAYDGNKNLITRKQLPFSKETTLMVDYEEDEVRKDNTKKISQFKVTVKPVHKRDGSGRVTCAINLDSLHQVYENRTGSVVPEAVMAIETILRHCPSLNLVPVGRSLYSPPDPRQGTTEISGGLDVWFGYHQSVHIGESRVLLNIDRATTVFYQPVNLMDLVSKILSGQGTGNGRDLSGQKTLMPYDIAVLSKELKNVKVFVKHLPYQRKFTIFNISKKAAKDIEFAAGGDGAGGTKELRRTNVQQYFAQAHNIRLKYPGFPCVNVGNSSRPVYLPFEVCFVKEDQPYRRKLNPRQTSEIIRCTAIPPRQRFEEIARKLRQMDQICDPIKKEFGIGIEKKPLQFQARQLCAPFLVYMGAKKMKPNNGVWDLKNQRFLQPGKIDKWALVSFGYTRFCGQREIENFCQKLQQEATNLGIAMGRPQEVYCAQSGREKAEDILKNLREKYTGTLSLVVIVLRDDYHYPAIKKMGDTVLGLPTQCIKEANVVKKCNPQLLCNLLQKINSKVGGINTSLSPDDKPDIFKRPVIIIGADVNHPAPGDRVKPSIAAVVGSMDGNPSRYAVSVRVQSLNARQREARLEIIQDLKSMIKEMLKAFFTNTRYKPEAIVFFRDGVSEGQFEEVRDREIAMIKAACAEMGTQSTYCPRLTFVVIQKRHHTRFAPAQDCDGVGKCGNIPPGTTVDSHVTDPHVFDFFQCSHFGIQGTSRPTKYTVLHDDCAFSADELQRLTYYLCHTYVRCTRSISVPAPVQYAHLAAFRAKEHLVSQQAACAGAYGDGSILSDEADCDISPELSREIMDAIKVPHLFANTMYFV